MTVRAARTPGAVEIHVVDQGPGMSEEERRHAFERFWRSGATGRGGSGLGLAIVHRLAQASGGTAELRAAEGGGVNAVITLPAAPAGGDGAADVMTGATAGVRSGPPAP